METQDMLTMAAYAVPMAFIWSVYWRRRHRRHVRSSAALESAKAAGLTEPASLHPLIDERHCIGCASCAKACPEGDVLGIIDGKAALINASHCIGHGACKRACPVDAIDLVFGTTKRGIDIPFVSESFETNVPGLFIAGELGGMGLIRNAITQGRQAMESIARLEGMRRGNDVDVVIVGAGPAGISASLAAMEHKLRYVTLEQESLGGTVSHYPRGKIVMTAPVKLPLVGMMKLRETTKESLMEFWKGIVERTGVSINYNERVESITPNGNSFTVKTPKATYQSRAVLLAIGRRGTPRKLGVPGEEMSKVVYRLIDPEQYRGKHVLVVGGGDSALEAATSIAAEPDTHVALSYRSESFSRAKEKNRQKVEQAEAAGRLRVLLQSNVKQITEDEVVLDHQGERIALRNEAVIVSAGGILPTGFLKDIGVQVETKYGTA
ncbi:MAG: NAD(P)-binding domain-containing protein [Gammaproteobacteria bacterium]